MHPHDICGSNQFSHCKLVCCIKPPKMVLGLHVGINSTKRQNLRPVQFERLCRQNKCDLFNNVLGRVENIVGKGSSIAYQHFLLFQQCFRKSSLSGSLKVGIVWERVNQPFLRTFFVFSPKICELDCN